MADSEANPSVFSRPPRSATALPAVAVDSTPHPWRRYFARMTDVMIFGMALGLAIGVAETDISAVSDVVLGLIVAFVWVFVEAVLLATWGTTPGKWMLSTTLRTTAGDKLGFPAALGRSLTVWIKGIGLGVPIVTLFTGVQAYKRLTEDGETSWDREGGFRVGHTPLTAGGLGALALVTAAWMLVTVVDRIL